MSTEREKTEADFAEEARKILERLGVRVVSTQDSQGER